ncbi:MAG: hypothetical protein U0936_19600 [Planctomycetaceae bacterium]
MAFSMAESRAERTQLPTWSATGITKLMDGRCTFLMILLSGAIQAICIAQDSGPELRATPNDNSSGILVLADGKVLDGRFLPRPDGYEVEVQGGRMFIESARVRFIARDFEDAYQRMRASFSELTPQSHMELARWCLNNKRTDLARREVLDALHKDPNRIDAQRLLQSLVQQSEQAPKSSRGSGLSEFPALARPAGPVPEARSLAGLSRSVSQDYTRHIQRILMNNCASAGCHGVRTTSSFQLASSHRGTSVSIAERNLAAVMKQIDLSRPSSSPLLSVLEGNHANTSAPLFRGRSGAAQMKTLRDWVGAVSNDIAPELNEEMRERQEQIQLASMSQAIEPESEAAVDETTMGLHGRVLTTTETDVRFLQKASRANARDAFDPAGFNQRFGKPTSTQNSDQAPKDNENMSNETNESLIQN